MVLILLGNLARPVKFEAFEKISRKIGLFLPRWKHLTATTVMKKCAMVILKADCVVLDKMLFQSS